MLSYFTIDCSADINPKNLEFILPDHSIIEPSVVTVSSYPMASTYKIILNIKQSFTEEVEKITEEFRERLVSFISIATFVDVHVSDEITIDDSGKVYTIVSRTDTKVPQKRNSLIKVFFNKDKLSNLSEEEWSAIKRFKKAYASVPLSEQFESIVGAIDILGKKYSKRKVGERIHSFIQKDLKMSNNFSELIVEARNSKIHDNRLDDIDINSISEIRTAVSNYFTEILGIERRKTGIEWGGSFRIYQSED